MAERIKKNSPVSDKETVVLDPLDVREMTLTKGLTLSLENLGGAKFEMARIDSSVTFRVNEGDSIEDKTKIAT